MQDHERLRNIFQIGEQGGPTTKFNEGILDQKEGIMKKKYNCTVVV